jgi:hypothetical protein
MYVSLRTYAPAKAVVRSPLPRSERGSALHSRYQWRDRSGGNRGPDRDAQSVLHTLTVFAAAVTAGVTEATPGFVPVVPLISFSAR